MKRYVFLFILLTFSALQQQQGLALRTWRTNCLHQLRRSHHLSWQSLLEYQTSYLSHHCKTRSCISPCIYSAWSRLYALVSYAESLSQVIPQRTKKFQYFVKRTSNTNTFTYLLLSDHINCFVCYSHFIYILLK